MKRVATGTLYMCLFQRGFAVVFSEIESLYLKVVLFTETVSSKKKKTK